jgi:hypothetical protein
MALACTSNPDGAAVAQFNLRLHLPVSFLDQRVGVSEPELRSIDL